MKDAEHPFFRPLWRRVAVVAFCAAWATWELWNGETVWATIALGMAVYAAWNLLLAYKPPPAAVAPTRDTAPDEKE